MIAQDFMFEIGSTHHICEDYAMNGSFVKKDTTFYYGVLCDGCSFSKNVDIGARLLAIAVKKTLMTMTFEELNDNIIKNEATILGSRIVNNLTFLDSSYIKDNAYDATLLFYITNGQYLRYFIFGDGCVIINNKTHREIVKIDYESNAPYYLSYGLECYAGREKVYLDTLADKIMTVETIVNGESKIEKISPLTRISGLFCLDCEDTFNISLYSDGIFSFVDLKGNRLVDESIAQYSNFPRFNGEYVRRNFQFNRKKNLKDQVSHQDDLSCVSFSFEKEVQ